MTWTKDPKDSGFELLLIVLSKFCGDIHIIDAAVFIGILMRPMMEAGVQKITAQLRGAHR